MDNTLLLFLVFFIGLFAGIPVALALALASIAYLLAADINVAIMANQFFSGMNSFVLVCVPGFLLAGSLMNGGGITDRIVNFVNVWLGHIRGGLAQANVGASMVFAGISGTAVSDSASIGAVLIPAMKRSGYDAPFSVAVTAASSCVGPIIPPSVPMIIVGALSGVSVGSMFIAGIIPGLMLGIGMMIVTYIISVRRNYPKGEKANWSQRAIAFKDAIWAVLTPIIIVGGLVSGFFTPTEAAIIAVIYAIIVGVFIYRQLTFKIFFECIRTSASGAANIVMLVGFANVFGWILTSEGIPKIISDSLFAITDNKYLMILIINIFLLFVGMFMETIAALLILYTPLALVASQIGMDPIQFSVMMVLNLVLGLTTPPVGVCLFVTQTIGKVTLLQAAKAVLPYLVVNFFILFLVAFVPVFTTWLPSVLLNK